MLWVLGEGGNTLQGTHAVLCCCYYETDVTALSQAYMSQELVEATTTTMFYIPYKWNPSLLFYTTVTVTDRFGSHTRGVNLAWLLCSSRTILEQQHGEPR